MVNINTRIFIRFLGAILSVLCFIVDVQAQDNRLINVEFQDTPLASALRCLEREGGKNILFVNDEVEPYNVTAHIQNQTQFSALGIILEDKPFTLLERKDYFVVQRKTGKGTSESIRGKVIDEQGKPISYANVLVLQASDSSFVTGCVTQDDGTFLLPNPYSYNYLLKVTYVGYQTLTAKCEPENILQMKIEENLLDEITITGSQPLVERKNGGYLTKVSGTVLALMGSAADMICHLPFVSGSDGNITVIGRGEPEIYINGRKVRDNTELMRLQANEVLSAEIITTPGARYSSEVKAVIRIRTIRQRGEGLSGSFYADYRQRHFANGNEGVSLNYRKGGLDIFAKTYFRENNSYTTEYTRTLMHTSSEWENVSDNISTGKNNYFNGEIGLNYELSDKQSVGLRYSPEQNIGNYENTELSSSEIFRDGELFDKLESDVTNKGKKGLEHTVNTYYYGEFGKWCIDFNADFYKGRNKRIQTVFNNQEKDAVSTNTINNKLYAIKLIISKQLEKGLLSLGSEDTWTDRHDKFEQSGFSADADDHIQQSVFSVFSDYSLNIGNFDILAGIRYEYQKTHYYEAGILQPTQSPSFHHVLPMVSATYKKDDWSAGLSYKPIKISPGYGMLSSAVTYVNKYQYFKGEPHLPPQIHHTVSFDAGWKWLNMNIYYDHTLNMYTSYLKPYDDDKYPGVSLDTNASVPHSDGVYITLSASPKFSFWQPDLTVETSWFFSDARSLGIEQRWKAPRFGFWLDNSFVLPKGWFLNISGYIKTKAKNCYTISRRRGSVDLQISKSFLPDKSLQVSLIGYDLFRTECGKFEMIYGDRTSTYYDGYADRQQIGLRISYKFNQTKNKYKGSGAGKSEKNRM